MPLSYYSLVLLLLLLFRYHEALNCFFIGQIIVMPRSFLGNNRQLKAPDPCTESDDNTKPETFDSHLSTDCFENFVSLAKFATSLLSFQDYI